MRKTIRLLAAILISSMLFSSTVLAAPIQAMNRTGAAASQRMEMQRSSIPDNASRHSEKPGQMAGSQVQKQSNGQGKIQEMMPPPEGSTQNPAVDPKTLQQTEQQGSLTQSSDYSYVYLMGNVTDTQYQTFSTYLNKVDEVLRTKFSEDGWKLILTSADLDDLLFQGQTSGVMGCTYFNQKVIYVNSGDYSYCAIHEMGHFLDYESSYASQTSEFASIFSSEASKLTEYGQTSATEFFAEVYQYQILQKDATITSCPNACTFVNKCLVSITD
jgi:hypothetical protein